MRSISILLLLSISIGDVLAQRIETINADMYAGTFEPLQRKMNYDEIEGSPYLDDDLIKGYVKFKLGDSSVYYLRYNIYMDEMEYLDGKQLRVIDNESQLDRVYVNGHTFYYSSYKHRNSFKEGYLKKVMDGDYALYIKYDVDFEKRKEAQSSYEQPTPDRFVKKSPTWYCSIKHSPIKFFDTDNSSLEELFREDYPALKKYIKSNKLKLRREEDVIKLFEYYNDAF